MESDLKENNVQEIKKEDEKGGVFSRSEYAKKEFWNERFEKHKSPFDWYLEYKQLKVFFDEIFPIKKTDKILMVGCGNARLSDEMYDDGYTDVINIDISDSVVEQMKKLAAKKNKNMTFLEMDATNMTFDSEYFDVIIDKGTLDALICGKDYTITDKLLIECMRVLKKEGKFYIITHGSPEGRRYIFNRSIGFDNYSYYVCKQKLSETAQLINIMRANLVDKPLNYIMKDKAALLKTMIEFMRMKKQAQQKLKSQKIVILKENEEKTESEDFYYLPHVTQTAVNAHVEEHEEEEEEEEKNEEPKEQHKIEEKTEENEEKKEKLKEQPKIEEKNEEPKEQPKIEEKEEKIEQKIEETKEESQLEESKKQEDQSKSLQDQKNQTENSTNEETKTEASTSSLKTEKIPEKIIYNPVRQPFCFVYQILKN